ncbi:bacteriohemerythrin [Agarivorans sp. B2Z047]|uniref:GGDEF domain-containing protein n=1 Tax=Agarivorans sp. B2Z047 TaxID=2652721 RepID=UPI00128BC3CF|nr:GGDEF domain-containing protein [Agarivorans sp. B2Z047]MPW30192.1 bacteriohemerythrin [Agarivorans sp. B2Z047]UQN43179.1 bacteriohemerythrin [Agarivorans sp. B2Z047]
MESFRWTSDFETGISVVDEQHRHLIDLINQIGEQLTDSHPLQHAAIESLSQELNNYVKEHFREEELLMAKHKVDPRHCQAHVKAHKEFVGEVAKLSQFNNDNKQSKIKHLLDYLIQWLAYHILGIDQVLTKQLHFIEAGDSPASAYSKIEQPNDLATEPLITALRGLFHQVSVRNNELLELNQNLEQKVQERTLALQKTNQHLQSLAHTDVLTGLPNRRHAMIQLMELWKQSLQSNSPLACMMIDADHFKQINDRNGHDAGDAVLMLLARALRESVRNDDVVARLGGDEFLLICPNTSSEGALNLGHSIRERIANMQLNHQRYSVTVSVGIASRSKDMQHHEAIMKAADKAVYKAKAEGKNCVRSYEDVSKQQAC